MRVSKEWLAERIAKLSRMLTTAQCPRFMWGELGEAAAILNGRRDGFTEAFCKVADTVRLIRKYGRNFRTDELSLLKEIDDTYDAWRESHS